MCLHINQLQSRIMGWLQSNLSPDPSGSHPQAELAEAAEGYWCFKNAVGEEEGPFTVSQLRSLHGR